MIYFIKTKTQVRESDNIQTIQTKLSAAFNIEEKEGFFTIIRDRVIGNRGILRIFFPVLVSKITLKDNYVHCKTKLDGTGFFILLMALGAMIVELSMDRDIYPREYPIYLPIGFFIWYIVSIIIESYRIKMTLSKKLE